MSLSKKKITHTEKLIHIESLNEILTLDSQVFTVSW